MDKRYERQNEQEDKQECWQEGRIRRGSRGEGGLQRAGRGVKAEDKNTPEKGEEERGDQVLSVAKRTCVDGSLP